MNMTTFSAKLTGGTWNGTTSTTVDQVPPCLRRKLTGATVTTATATAYRHATAAVHARVDVNAPPPRDRNRKRHADSR
jgi:hypothetical protein